MSGADPRAQARPFALKRRLDTRSVVAARWWRKGVISAAPLRARGAVNRRQALGGLVALAGAIGVGGLIVAKLVESFRNERRRDAAGGAWGPLRQGDGAPVRELIDVQREHGWATGASKVELEFEGAVAADADGAPVQEDSSQGLASDLSPSGVQWRPFYNPTLFQILDGPGGASLRRLMKPIDTSAMRVAESVGASLRSLFRPEDSATPDIALVIDLPGPESIAMAAGLAPAFQPVCVFGNWPHPNGVVPSHRTLAAALFHRPSLIRSGAEAPPAFVLDRARLAAYGADGTRFDNRYVAALPSAAALKDRGVSRVIYVMPDASTPTELDDLNDDFVGWREEGIEIRLLAATDFHLEAEGSVGVVIEGPEGAASEVPSAPPGPEGDPVPAAPATNPASRSAPTETRTGVERRYYGGSMMTHWWFWYVFPWRSPAPAMQARRPLGVLASGAYRAAPRATMFSTGLPGGPVGGAKPKPSGFGRVAYRPIAGSGSSGNRSGSWTRTGSSGGG